jgi:signal transduction histidine kinase/CheY-like chemotaxis protein
VYREEQKSQEKALSGAARTFALLVDNELHAREAVLRTLAKSPDLAKGDWQGFYAYAKKMAPTPESTIILLLPNGEQLLNTRLPFGSPLPKRSASNRQDLTQKYGADKTIVSDVFISSIGKRHDFTIQVPVHIGDGAPSFLVMGINAFEMNKLMAAQRFPEQWVGTVVDRQGQVVARSRDPDQYTGKVIRDYSRRILASTAEGTYPSVTLEGIPVKAFFSHIPIADWKVLISIPEAEIQRGAIRAATFLAGILFILLIFAIAAARWVAQWVITPIEDLGKAAERLGRGQEVTYVSRGLQEADLVGHTIVEASRRIQRSTAELRQRVDDAVSATRRAERALLQSQKLEALGRLTGGIAHEFNNLLQTLATSLQLAGMTTREPRTQALVQTSQKAVERAGALTRQLSVFGRVQDARLETVDMKNQITGFLQLIEGALPGNIGLDIDFADDLWPVTLDALQLELALLNIALNARDAMPSGGVLRLEVGNTALREPAHGLPAGEYVHLRMTDNGSGMTAEALSKALDPFFTTKAVGKGSGMGLTQAYGFATQANGTLVLKSAEGEGTSVEIYLPRATGPAVASSAPGPVDPMRVLTDRTASRATVLFVEDDALVREAVVPALQAAGIDVLVAETGDDALAILDGGGLIDALLSDIVMPGRTSGIDLAAIARERFPRMKVILATGYSEQRITLPGVRLLAKPYEITKVIALLLHRDEPG